MKVLILGDRFMTNEILKEAMDKRFADSNIELEYVYHMDQWPVEPLQVTDEVSEFCGCDDEIVPLVADVDAILTHTGCISKKVIDAAKELKVVALGRGGPVNVNKDACTDRKIPILYAPGRNSGAVAEYTIGMILAVMRSIPLSHYYLRYKNEWRGDYYAYESVGKELVDSTIGLIGFGAIGRKVAKIMSAFGTKVMVADPYLSEDDKSTMKEYEFVELDTLLKKADIISLHTKFTPETEGMIGKREIGLMKETAVFINTARGQLVDHDALYQALAEKSISGAGLDVFEAEPPEASSQLFTLENVVATPHLGGASIGAAKIGASIAADQIYKYMVECKAPEYWFNKFELK